MIKCALCSANWENMAGTGGYFFHPNNSCPLGDLDIPDFAVRSINTAIEAAKAKGNSFQWTAEVTDPRKPEECSLRRNEEGFCNQQIYDGAGKGHYCCPCAAWRKE